MYSAEHHAAECRLARALRTTLRAAFLQGFVGSVVASLTLNPLGSTPHGDPLFVALPALLQDCRGAEDGAVWVMTAITTTAEALKRNELKQYELAVNVAEKTQGLNDAALLVEGIVARHSVPVAPPGVNPDDLLILVDGGGVYGGSVVRRLRTKWEVAVPALGHNVDIKVKDGRVESAAFRVYTMTA